MLALVLVLVLILFFLLVLLEVNGERFEEKLGTAEFGEGVRGKTTTSDKETERLEKQSTKQSNRTD